MSAVQPAPTSCLHSLSVQGSLHRDPSQGKAMSKAMRQDGDVTFRTLSAAQVLTAQHMSWLSVGPHDWAAGMLHSKSI